MTVVPPGVSAQNAGFSVLHSCLDWAPLTQTWLQNQILAQQDAGLAVSVVTNRCSGDASLQLCPVESLDRYGRMRKFSERLKMLCVESASYKHFHRAVRAVNPSIIHSHFGNVAWADAKANTRQPRKHVMSVYGYDIEQLPGGSKRWAKRYELLKKKVDLVFCEGRYVRERLIDQGFDAQRVVVNQLGVDLDGLQFQPTLWDGEQPLRVLMVATFREKKGIPVALEALDRLMLDIPLELTLVGDAGNNDQDRREKDKILAMTDRLPIGKNVRLLGFQPQDRIVAEARRHHLFLQPSMCARNGDTEGGAPVSLIEMQALGLPVLATTHCDIPAIVAEGYRPYLAREGDSSDLFEQLAAFINLSDHWEQYVRDARKFVETEFSLAIQTQRQISIYRQLLA